MATAMKINKAKYLEACQKALAEEKQKKAEYDSALERYNNELRVWAEMVITKRMFAFRISDNWRPVTFSPNSEAEALQPEKPLLLQLRDGYNSTKVEALSEAIALIEMTEGETIGISVANKVSHYLRGN